MLFYKILACFFFFLGLILIGVVYVTSQAKVDLSIKIESEYSIISAGNDIIVWINLMQPKYKGRRDIFVVLELLDDEDKIIGKSTETVALETKTSLVSRLRIPETSNEGTYNVNVKIFDSDGGDLLEIDSRQIIVEKTRITRLEVYLIGGYLSAIILFILIIILFIRMRYFRSKIKVTKQDLKEYLEQRRD